MGKESKVFAIIVVCVWLLGFMTIMYVLMLRNDLLCLRDHVEEQNKQVHISIAKSENDRMQGVDMDIPIYWKNHLDERCEQICLIMSEAGWNKSAFLWYTDAHWSYSYQKAPLLLKYLYEHTPINKVNFGGDIIAVEEANIKEMHYLWDWRSQIRGLPNHHSVPGNHDDGNDVDGRYTTENIYSYLLAPEETSDVVRGENGLYYYIDSPLEKTRYLYLDTATSQGMIIRDEKQKEWLTNSLLTTPDNWHIIAFAHIWRNVDYHNDPPVDNGFSLGGTLCLKEFDSYNQRIGLYSNCKGTVEFCMGGHTHVDGVFRSESGIPVIITETDSYVTRGGIESASGTINESSINAVIADYESRVIHVVRVGRGESRIIAIAE